MIGSKPLTDEEVNLILNNLNSPRDKCFFILGLKTGFRVSELLSIKIVDLLEHNGMIKNHITIMRSKMKGKTHSRSVPISLSTIEILKGYLSTIPKTQEYLFQSQKGGRLSRVQAHRIIKDATHSAGINGRVSCHSTRKTFAKGIYNASGKDLVRTQKALGHVNVNSTVSYLNGFSTEEIDQLILLSVGE